VYPQYTRALYVAALRHVSATIVIAVRTCMRIVRAPSVNPPIGGSLAGIFDNSGSLKDLASGGSPILGNSSSHNRAISKLSLIGQSAVMLPVERSAGRRDRHRVCHKPRLL